MKLINPIRADILKYAKENFNTEPDHPWEKYPEHIVLRHKDNFKWYALLMEVSKDKLGLCGDENVDILNIKCDPILIGSLLDNNGYLPAYHMNKEHWITIVLDGSVSSDEIFNLLNMSFEMTN